MSLEKGVRGKINVFGAYKETILPEEWPPVETLEVNVQKMLEGASRLPNFLSQELKLFPQLSFWLPFDSDEGFYKEG